MRLRADVSHVHRSTQNALGLRYFKRLLECVHQKCFPQFRYEWVNDYGFRSALRPWSHMTARWEGGRGIFWLAEKSQPKFLSDIWMRLHNVLLTLVTELCFPFFLFRYLLMSNSPFRCISSYQRIWQPRYVFPFLRNIIFSTSCCSDSGILIKCWQGWASSSNISLRVLFIHFQYSIHQERIISKKGMFRVQ